MGSLGVVEARGEGKLELQELQVALANMAETSGTANMFSAMLNGICGIALVHGVLKEDFLDCLEDCWEYHKLDIEKRRAAGEFD